MAPTARAHKRSHNLLLLQKLLNLRDSASPLTLVLDSLEQTAGSVVREFVARAKIAKTKTVFVSFATFRKPQDVDVFVKVRGQDLSAVRAEVIAQYPPRDAASGRASHLLKTVVIVDSLNALATAAPQDLTSFLSMILAPSVSVVAIYHTDVPLPLPRTWNEYAPPHLTVLCHLATTILRVSGLEYEIERQKARNRSVPEPEWGLREGREGVLVGLRSKDNIATSKGVILDMEMRRRSGRSTSERFVLSSASMTTKSEQPVPGKLSLLSDHPMFRVENDDQDDTAAAGDGQEPETTFNLGLTDKQRRDREGIVLPYFDAQTDIGAGEGGRILYDMGREDDFDDEEDEI